jgi:hypothetical protein
MGLREDLLLTISGDSAGGQQAVTSLAETLRGSVKAMEADVARLSATSKGLGLTSEQTRGLLVDQLDQYRQAGIVAPASLLNIERAARSVTTATKDQGVAWSGAWATLRGFAGPLGIGLGATAIVSFVKDLAAGASEIKNVASKLEVSTDAVQRWTYGVEKAGGTFADVSSAVSTMNKKLAEASDETKVALHDARLEFETIRKMRPEDAFEAIATAIKGIEDPMTRARVAGEMFRSQNLLPAINAGLVEIGNSAPVMAQKHVEAWDRMGTAAAGYWARTKQLAGDAGGAVVLAIQETIDLEEDLKPIYAEIARLRKTDVQPSMTNLYPRGLPELSDKQVRNLAEENLLVKAIAEQLVKMVPPREAANKLSLQAITLSDSELRILTGKLNLENDLADIRAREAQKLAQYELDTKNNRDQAYNATVESLRKHYLEVASENGKSVLKMIQNEQKLRQERSIEYNKTLESIKQHYRDVASANGKQVLEVLKAEENVRHRLDDLYADATTRRLNQIQQEWDAERRKNASTLDNNTELYKKLERETDEYYRRLIEQETSWRGVLARFRDDLAAIASSARGAFGTVLQEVGRGINAIQMFDTGIRTTQSAFEAMSQAGKMSFDGIRAAATGVLGVLGGVMSIVNQIYGAVSDKGTDAVQDFMNKNTWGRFGKGANGFHSFLYESLGVEAGEALWIKGTQKIGKHDQAGARAWQDEVLAALQAVGKSGGIQKFKTGGLGDFGPEGTLAMLHGREANVPLDKLGQFMNAAEKAALGRERSAPNIVVPVDARGAHFRDRQSIRDLADQVADAIMERQHQLYPVTAR